VCRREKGEREKREMFNVCVWHQNVHWVARRQTPNDKKKKTDARREKERFFYSHTKMKQKREREKGKDWKKRCERNRNGIVT